MRSLFAYLGHKLSRSILLTFIGLFVVVNLTIIAVNTMYINATINRQNDNLIEMVEHLVLYTDDDTVITYLEHYGHTHEVRLDYETLDGLYAHRTERLPTSDNAYTVYYNGAPYAVLIIDNAQSSVWVANVIYMIIINGLLIGLYGVFMVYFRYRLKTQHAVILNDFEHLQKALDAVVFDERYYFLEFAKLEGVFAATIEKVSRLQVDHKRQIQELAHDIKTPLTIIRGLMDGVMQARIAFNDETKASLDEEVNHIRALIDKIIDQAIDETFQSVDLSVLIKESVRRHGDVFKQRRVKLKLDLREEVRVYGDAEGLRRVFEHLLQNSLKYSDAEAEVSVILSADKLIVKDTGRGMDQDTIDAIFKVQERDEGSGVGLYIVKNILEAHGFKITVDSEVHQGTVITIYLDS